MRCMTCGAESSPTAKFCETCGSPLQQTQQQPAWSAGQTAGQPAAAGQQPQQWQSASNTQPNAAAYPTASYAPAPTPQPPQGKQASSAPFVLAIIALVTALLGLFPVSLVLAIIALAMNSGQKKRGEQSTKQTPTFVMGLISLILSILAAVATLLLGGAVWLALLDDASGAGSSSGPATAASSQAAAATNPAGVWTVVSLTDGDETYDEECLQLMEDMGISFELILAKDGTAALEFFDESEAGIWEDRSSGKVALTFDGDTVVATIEGDELTLAEDGETIVFRRTSAEAPATAIAGSGADASAASSSSAASSNAAASPSSSAAAPSASSTAGTQSTVGDAQGEPTLGDFTWYAGAGGIPESATILTSVYDVEGIWKAYIFGNEMERLCTMRIAAGQASVTATIDWLYVHDSSTDTGGADDTPDSAFEGDWDGSLGLEALGPGRLALTDFWQKGDHQYGMGSFMWPSGETDMVLLVRP